MDSVNFTSWAVNLQFQNVCLIEIYRSQKQNVSSWNSSLNICELLLVILGAHEYLWILMGMHIESFLWSCLENWLESLFSGILMNHKHRNPDLHHHICDKTENHWGSECFSFSHLNFCVDWDGLTHSKQWAIMLIEKTGQF